MAYFYPQYLEEMERTRKGATTKALTGRDVDPFAQALEAYGTTAARLAEERARSTQIKKEYLQSKGQRIQEVQQKQQTKNQAVSGVGNLALTGYALGKSAGLWGGTKAGATTLTNTAGLVPSSAAEAPLVGMASSVPEMVSGGGAAFQPMAAGGLEALADVAAVAPAAITEGAGLVGGSGLGAGTALGAEAAAIGTTAATTAATTASTTAATAATAATTATTATTSSASALTPLLAFLGCCFNFLEAEGEITEYVRKYRDEHYLNTDVAIGYKLMAFWLVPLMREHKWVKSLVRYTMTRPLTKYAEWYYGKNWYGWVFIPSKLWVVIWNVYGKIIGGLRWQIT